MSTINPNDLKSQQQASPSQAQQRPLYGSPPNSGSSNPFKFGVNTISVSNSPNSRGHPFLNLINPMGRQYQGYVRADQQPVLEEDEEDEGVNDTETEREGGDMFRERESKFKKKASATVTFGGGAGKANQDTSRVDGDVERGNKISGQSTVLGDQQRPTGGASNPPTKSRHVTWNPGASEMNLLGNSAILHRNPVMNEDNNGRNNNPFLDEANAGEDDDDEVPASFMVEATPTAKTSTKTNRKFLVSKSPSSVKGKEVDRGVTIDARPADDGTEEVDLGPRVARSNSSTSHSDGAHKRAQPLYTASGVGRRLPPAHPPPPPSTISMSGKVSIPPRPSELDPEYTGNLDNPYSNEKKHGKGASESSSYTARESQGRRTGGTFGPTSAGAGGYRPPIPTAGLDPCERALWNWVNVYNLDAFLQEVYVYYEGKGIYSIALSRLLNLLTVGFVIGFSTFLLGCIDYSKIRHGAHTRLSEVMVDRCVSRFSGFKFIFFILFTAFYAWQIVDFLFGLRRLHDIYNFYTYLLKIPDEDISTIAWPEVVRRIGAIREQNPLTAISSHNSRNTNDISKAKLDAHDIANRIMRQENYLIALFNKELLDLRVPLPSLLRRFVTEEEGKGKTLTKALEWNLRFCLMEFLFDKQGRVKKAFLKSKNRRTLIEGLRRRFIFMGMLNAIFVPFIVPYILMYSFFRYFEQYHKDPSSIGGRRYTSYAQWKFREFNELPHFFTRRLDASYELANIYIGRFPNAKMAIIMRFVAFISGSFVAIMFLATMIDPEVFLLFEITPHRSIVFYLGVFGAILTVARGMIPEDNRVYDPELLMTGIIECTHYMPDEWKGQLHSKKVHQEFGEIFAMKILIFVQELLSVVLTPLVLWLSLPNCAPAIIDFFREFSVHVEGRGYVCSFAEFNFDRHGNVKFGAPTQPNDQKMVSNQGKMEKSFLNFKFSNPEWNPTDPSGSLYLSRIAQMSMAYPQIGGPGGRRSHPPTAQMNTNQQITPRTSTRHINSTSKSNDFQPDASILTEKAQEYDRALRQSQMAATRRRGVGMGGNSIMSMSTLTAAQHNPSSSSIFGPYGGLAMAQTTVLGDSQGSMHPGQVNQPQTSSSSQNQGQGASGGNGNTKNILNEDITPDGGVGSGLGESYVDGGNRELGYQLDEDEDDGAVDGGVLDLLAQIYGRREGAAGVLRR